MRKLVVNVVLAILSQKLVAVESGIPGFHKWFAGAFPSAVTTIHPGQKETFDHVCIDMNQILHVSLRKSRNERAAVHRIFGEVDGILRRCQPRKSVVFAFDGSAPLAKLVVQRSRRENTKRNAKYGMSALHLSPGTDFMDCVASAMEYYAFQEVKKPWCRGVSFYVSGASVPGEGELKCIDWVKHMCSSGTEESTVIIGGDADLILQGLALGQVKNMFVFSQADKGTGRLSSMWEVIRSLEKLFPGQSEFIRADLMLLVILNGNDYLPKARGVTFGLCFRTYLKLKAGKYRDSYLVDGQARSFNWEFCVDIFSTMASGLAVKSARETDRMHRYPPAGSLFNQAVQQGRLGDDALIDMEIHHLPKSGDKVLADAETATAPQQWRSITTVNGRKYSWEHTALKKKAAMHQAAEMLLKELLPDLHEQFMEQEAARLVEESLRNTEDDGPDSEDGYSTKREPEISTERPDADRPLFDVEMYLIGLLWNLQMYVDGYTPNFYWLYGLPYAPSCSEIVSWIQQHPDKIPAIRPSVSSAPPLPGALACVCMMPMTEEGHEYLPRRLQPLMRPGSPLREALEWTGEQAGLDMRKILDAVNKEAPAELIQFHNNSHSRHAWKVIYFDPSDPTEGAKVPPTPFIGFRPISETRHIHVTTMSATATPPCLPWSSPTNPDSWQQPQAVTDQPFKRAFVKNPYQGSKDAGGRGMSPQSSAWRKDATGNSASRSRKGGRGGRGGRGERARETFRTGDAGETMPRASPARRGLRAGPPAGQQHTGTSMRFGRALGRPNVRLRV